nr:ATP synthase F0 subunit 6 [Dikraneurini sp. SL-2021a]
MMNNLFSVFDPCTGYFSLNWLSTLWFLMMTPYTYWYLPNKISYLFNKMMNIMKTELKPIMPYKGTTIIMIMILIKIMIDNTMGLLPYMFTASSHLIFSLSMALPMWIGFMFYGWMNKTNYMFSHLLPTNTPSVLMPFMIIIETISNIIRPGSLSVRLTANMIAGHLLMSLLGGNTLTPTMMMMTMIIYSTLMMFELAVAMIQSYVFMTLTTLYSSEV